MNATGNSRLDRLIGCADRHGLVTSRAAGGRGFVVTAPGFSLSDPWIMLTPVSGSGVIVTVPAQGEDSVRRVTQTAAVNLMASGLR